MKNNICPNCGKHSIGFLKKIASSKIFRFNKKPFRCSKCNGYYKLITTPEYFSKAIYKSLLLFIFLAFAILMYITYLGFGIEADLILNLVLILFFCVILFLFTGIFTLGVESCNHKYQLLPHETDIFCEALNLKQNLLFLKGIYQNNILLLDNETEKIPVMIKKIKEEKGIVYLDFSFINSAFYKTEKLILNKSYKIYNNKKEVMEIKISNLK